METTLILLKPDAVQRGLMGRIISRFEEKGLQIVGCKLMQISPELAARHYEAHKERPFYAGLVRFMTSSPVLALALRGNGAITIARNMMGATFGSRPTPARSAATLVSPTVQPHPRQRQPQAAERDDTLLRAGSAQLEQELRFLDLRRPAQARVSGLLRQQTDSRGNVPRFSCARVRLAGERITCRH